MSDTNNQASERSGWLAYPLLVFAASRVLLFSFAKSAPIFGGKLGADPGLPQAFLFEHPFWAALGHGEFANYARIARTGYVGLGDAAYLPLVPLLGKGLGAAFGSIEIGLIVLSLFACAVGFVGSYRLFDHLRGRDTARWGVALLAAFPFAYHLSDGSSLACLLAFSTWGVLLALRGSCLSATAILSLGVRAHPVGVFSGLALAGAPAWVGPRSTPWRKWTSVIVPGLVLALWPVYLRIHLGTSTAMIWGALWPKNASTGFAWSAMLIAFGALAGGGILLLARLPGLRVLALAGGLQLGFALQAWNPASAVALVVCWPAFLGLGDLLARRQALRAPLVAMLGAHQGLLLYCFTHFVRLT